jgi:hypothetical protein
LFRNLDQWVAPFLLLGVYNKIVKVAGSDAKHLFLKTPGGGMKLRVCGKHKRSQLLSCKSTWW